MLSLPFGLLQDFDDHLLDHLGVPFEIQGVAVRNLARV